MLTWEQQQIQGAGPIVQKLAVSRIERVVLRSRSSSRLPLGNGCGNIVDSAERNAGGNASSRRSDGAKAALPAHTLAAQPSGSRAHWPDLHRSYGRGSGLGLVRVRSLCRVTR